MNMDMWERFLTEAFGFVTLSFGVAISIRQDQGKEIALLSKLNKPYRFLYYLGVFLLSLIFILTIRPAFNGYDVMEILSDPFAYLWGSIIAIFTTAGISSYWIVLRWRYRKWNIEPSRVTKQKCPTDTREIKRVNK